MSTGPRRVGLVIPAYEPNDGLPALVRAIVAEDSDRLLASIVVVDDGSGERFEAVFRQVEAVPGAAVVRRDANGGTGAALKTGIACLLDRALPIVGIVTADADSQHAPHDIVRVAAQLTAEPDRLVIGVRRFDSNMPFRSRLGNVVTRALVRLSTGVALDDTQSGLRGWPIRLCVENLQSACDGFDYQLDTLLNATDDPVTQLPIDTIYFDANRASHFRPLRDSLRVSRVLARYLLARFLDR